MDDNKNSIGIVGYWFATNYGGVASYFSLYSTLKKMGYNPFLVENPYLNIDREGVDVFSRNFFKQINAYRYIPGIHPNFADVLYKSIAVLASLEHPIPNS